jgi:hypothetical protein
MFIMIYTLLWLAVLAVTNLFSFVLGRCARKLPVIDYGLPWVMHRSAVPYDHDRAQGDPDRSTTTETQHWGGRRPAA